MESLITEPGPRNPLLFLSLSLVNRIPGYNPDEKETLNQLECMNDLISSVSASVFRLDSVRNAVAVAVDALMTISVAEAKKSVSVRLSALNCLFLLIDKVAASGVSSLIEIIPGILSKMIKICTGRVDVEVDGIIGMALKIIERVVQCFWDEQKQDDSWSSYSLTPEALVLLKQKYRENVDLVVCSLRPLIKSQSRIETHRLNLVNIFNYHIKACPNPSLNCLKLALLLNYQFDGRCHKQLVQIYNTEIVEWFDINSESLSSIHEDILTEKIQWILSLISAKNSQSFLLITDLFLIVKQLTGLKVSIGDTVSIEYSDSSYGINDALRCKDETNFNGPNIVFKKSLKLSKDFYANVDELFAKIVQLDAKALEKCMLNFIVDDGSLLDSLDLIIQKIDLASLFYKHHKYDSSELFKDCLKYHERCIKGTGTTIEKSQMIHLAVLKLIWNHSQNNPFSKTNLLIILSAMTSDRIILRETSTQILKRTARALNSSDVREFVKEHECFLLDRLAIQLALPAFYPEAPQIIACLTRDILDPPSALKFTDLLVKKVSDNLALYQKHAGYCKDLLAMAGETVAIVSRTEAVEFADPKNFAFTTNDEEANEASPLNCQQRIILDLLKIGINFILSDSKSIRAKSLNLIQSSVTNFIKYNLEKRQEPSELCQLVHLAWPNMIAVVKDSLCKDALQLDVAVIEAFGKCCQVLFERLPIFMRDRFVKDFWKSTLKLFAAKQLKFNNFGLYHPFLQICRLLIDVLNAGIVNCKPSTEICIEIIDVLGDKEGELGVFESISQIEPDVIWYFYSCELGGLEEITSRCPELKSFKIISSKPGSDTLKRQLKQFIY